MIILDEKILRVSCTDATVDEATLIIEALELELAASALVGRPGIGLAAPQIGIHKNVAIVRVPSKNNEHSYNVNLVNPRIKQGYDLSFFENEGCLSFPGLLVRTRRFQEIHVVDNLVEPYSFIATGLFAVCIQHELDHLKNILLPDLSH